MISEAVAALVAGVFGYMAGAQKGNQRSHLRDIEEAEWVRKYDTLQKLMAQKLDEANFQLKLKVYLYERDMFFNKIKGRSFSEFTTVYSADFKSHGKDRYSENHIAFPTEAEAHFYGKRGLSGKYSFADYHVVARLGFPNALARNGRWLFCAPGGDYDMYIRRKGENDWVPRQDYPPAWIVEGHTKYRFETKEEAHLYAGYLELASKLSLSSVVVLETEDEPNAAFYGLKLEKLEGDK